MLQFKKTVIYAVKYFMHAFELVYVENEYFTRQCVYFMIICVLQKCIKCLVLFFKLNVTLLKVYFGIMCFSDGVLSYYTGHS